MAFFKRAPSDWVMSTEGMVIVGSVPPIVGGGDPGRSLTSMTTTTAWAPASCAFLTLTTKLHVPRSSRTTPDSGEPNALQPCVEPVLSLGAVRGPMTPGLVSGGPN